MNERPCDNAPVRMLVPLLLLLAAPIQAGHPPLPDLLTRAQQRLEASDRSRARPELAEARSQTAALLRVLGESDRSLEHLARLSPTDQERPSALAVRCADHAGRGERAEADRAAERLLGRPDLAEGDVQPILPTLAAHG